MHDGANEINESDWLIIPVPPNVIFYHSMLILFLPIVVLILLISFPNYLAKTTK